MRANGNALCVLLIGITAYFYSSKRRFYKIIMLSMGSRVDLALSMLAFSS